MEGASMKDCPRVVHRGWAMLLQAMDRWKRLEGSRHAGELRGCMRERFLIIKAAIH